MSNDAYRITALAVLIAAAVVFAPELAHAAGIADPLARKANDARDQLITIGQAVTGLVGVILLILAAFGKVSWYWLGMDVAAGACLQGYSSIESWLNS